MRRVLGDGAAWDDTPTASSSPRIDSTGGAGASSAISWRNLRRAGAPSASGFVIVRWRVRARSLLNVTRRPALNTAERTAPPEYCFKLVTTEAELDAALALRYAIFVEEIGAFRANAEQREASDTDLRAKHFIALDGARVVGTVRLEFADSPSEPTDPGHRFAGEAHYDYGALRRDGVPLAEVARTAVARPYRDANVFATLWKCAYQYAKRHGRLHLMCCVHVGFTDSLTDAELVYGTLRARAMLHPRYELLPRSRERAPASPAHPLYTPEIRARRAEVPLPASARLFHRYGLRACGPPLFMPEIGRVGMAMLADTTTFSRATLDFFERPDPRLVLA
jgi:putative hemolysin